MPSSQSSMLARTCGIADPDEGERLVAGDRRPLQLHRWRGGDLEPRSLDAHPAIVERGVRRGGGVEDAGRFAHAERVGVLVEHVRGDRDRRARAVGVEWLDGESGRRRSRRSRRRSAGWRCTARRTPPSSPRATSVRAGTRASTGRRRGRRCRWRARRAPRRRRASIARTSGSAPNSPTMCSHRSTVVGIERLGRCQRRDPAGGQPAEHRGAVLLAVDPGDRGGEPFLGGDLLDDRRRPNRRRRRCRSCQPTRRSLGCRPPRRDQHDAQVVGDGPFGIFAIAAPR